MMSANSVHIRSKDRVSRFATSPADFTVNLYKPQKIHKARLSSLQLPASYWNVTSYNNTYSIGAISGSLVARTLQPGCYTLNELMGALQTDLNTYGLGTFTVTFNSISSKLTI